MFPQVREVMSVSVMGCCYRLITLDFASLFRALITIPLPHCLIQASASSGACPSLLLDESGNLAQQLPDSRQIRAGDGQALMLKCCHIERTVAEAVFMGAGIGGQIQQGPGITVRGGGVVPGS